MTKEICRVCLCTNKTLRELDERLSDYFLQICNAKRSTKCFFCISCEGTLQNHLEFRDKCGISNQILEEWENNDSQNKLPIESLHKLLITDNKYLEITKFETALIYSEATNDDDDVKEEVKANESEAEENQDSIEYDSNVKNVRIKKTLKKNTRSIDIPVTKKFKLRGEIAKRSEFTQFETVFDITSFATYAEARAELMSRRDAEPYLSSSHRCDVCYSVYKNDGLLQYHMKWHDPSSGLSHECDVCGMRFSSRGTLLGHKPNCHRAKFACKMCPLVTYRQSAMKAHFHKHQGKTFKCCDRIFKHISSYLTHKRNVHASRHVCVTCARTFVSEIGLRNHRHKMHKSGRKVDSEGAVRCVPCGLTFASQQVYTVHVLNTEQHKDIATTLVACSVCGLSFEDIAQVKEHKRLIHSRTNSSNHKNKDTKEEKLTDVIECKLCGLSGVRPSWLYQHHRRQHPAARYEAPRGQREFLCDQCGKAFYKKLQLEEHKYVHSGLKPFRCETCHKAFRTKMSLKNHGERHAPPSRECRHCGKKFNSAANLSNHIRTHTGDRRFICSYCGKGFLHRAALTEHTRAVHLHIRRERNTNK